MDKDLHTYTYTAMESNFRSYLLASGITESTITVLEEELVLSSALFGSLREEHFEKLLPKLRVGEHAALWQLWESQITRHSEVRDHVK